MLEGISSVYDLISLIINAQKIKAFHIYTKENGDVVQSTLYYKDRQGALTEEVLTQLSFNFDLNKQTLHGMVLCNNGILCVDEEDTKYAMILKTTPEHLIETHEEMINLINKRKLQ